MVALHEVLSEMTLAWKAKGWASEEYPVIAEILEWAANPDGSGYNINIDVAFQWTLR